MNIMHIVMSYVIEFAMVIDLGSDFVEFIL